MPEIIGKDQSVYKQLTCRHCGSINKYLPIEIRTLWSSKDYSGGSDGAEGFNCADCGKEVITRVW